MKYILNWEVGWHSSPDEQPSRRVPATVPGAVQLDWARAENWKPFFQGENWRDYRWMEDAYWSYTTRLSGDWQEGQRLHLVCEGVDYQCEIFLNGAWLHAQEGAQTPIDLDLTGRAGPGDELRILIHPAPKSVPAPDSRDQANRSCKPAVSYGWDFHPRLIPLGLWRDAYLETRSEIHFNRPPDWTYQLSDDFSTAAGELHLSLNRRSPSGARIRLRLSAPDGTPVLAEEVALSPDQVSIRHAFSLPSVTLWWPHDQGVPALYAAEVELLDPAGRILDQDTRQIGFRRVRLVMAPDQWKHPASFPKSRSFPPITLEINGRSLFAKGSNWVCPDIFPGTLTPERYAAQLALVRQSNLALLRMWGGAGAPHDAFYDECDRLGIMVWQEFPLGCNLYPDDRAYLAVLDQESRSLIQRLKPHPSVVLWCGGNELFNNWSGMTDQSLPLRLLNRNCYDLDPDRPFLPTSPVDGMGHGHYVFRDPDSGQECWSIFQNSACTAYTEFGCPSPASVEILRQIIPENELWPPQPGASWESHHAFGVWLPTSHLYLAVIEHYFGPSASLEELVDRGQMLQAAGYQGLFEEARRQKPVASMALNWCFNEPWPCAANNSLVSWPCEPKPALKAVAAACRTTMASARIKKFSWQPGEDFDPGIWLLHDGHEPLSSLRIGASLELDGRRHPLVSWATGPIAANTHYRGPTAHFILPLFSQPSLTLFVEVEGHPEWDSTYTLLKVLPKTEAVPTTGTMNF